MIVHEFDEGLQLMGEVHWEPVGRVPGGVHVVASGEIVAVVVDGEKVRLSGWDVRGHERFRRAVKLGGEIRASRVDGHRSMIVVTNTEVVKLRLEDGTIVGRSPLGFDPAKANVRASPQGAWFAFSDRIVWAGLDGRRTERPLPVAVPAAPRNGLAAMLATERGECLLAEKKVTEHPVKGREHVPDVTTERVLTLLGPGGDVVGNTTFAIVRKRREWFWSEQTRGSTLPVPNDAGLVRTRWDGRVEIQAWGERADGDVVVVLWEELGHDERLRLVRLDRSLRKRWSRRFEGSEATAVSPPWTTGILVHAGLARVRSYDEQGESERAGSYSYPRDVDISKIAGVALGRGPDGRWIVVEWTGK